MVFIYIVKALVQKELNSVQSAIDLLIKSIQQDNLNWLSWKELAFLIPNFQKVFKFLNIYIFTCKV